MPAPLWFTEPLVLGDSGKAVGIVRRKLRLTPGDYDGGCVAAVRAFQRGAHLPMTGVVDEETAAALGEREGFGLLPPWWPGSDVSEGSEVWDHHVSPSVGDSDGLKRFQGTHHLPPTGVVDETTARLLYGLE